MPASKVGAELCFDVISTAYERTSLIVTTNLPFESWTEVLGSERLHRGEPRPAHPPMPDHRDQGGLHRLSDAKARTRQSAVTGPSQPVDEAPASK